jgi:ferredoxin
MYHVVPDECVGCEACLNECSQDVLFMTDEEYAYLDQDKCIGCGACYNICPVCAIIGDSAGYEENADPYYWSFNLDVFDSISEPFWTGAPYLKGGDDPNGVDCSHLVWQIYWENDLYYDYEPTAYFYLSDEFIEVTNPQDGDVIVWPGHHMGIYIENPPTPGYNIYGATKYGVQYGRISWWSIDEGLGKPTYYRYQRP